MAEGSERWDRLLRAYETLTGVLSAQAAAASEAELLAEVCRVAVEEAGYRLAWIGYVDAGTSRVRPVASRGYDEGYLQSITVTWDDGPHGQGPTGTAIRTRKTSVAQDLLTSPEFDPWRSEALHRGYASSAALVLQHGRQVYGTLNLYAPEPNAFDADEIELLERVSEACATGIRLARGMLHVSEMQRELERLDRLDAMSRVAATVVHDVNNCLAAVLPALRACEGTQLGEEARVAVERAIALNRQLMGTARQASDRAPPGPLDDLIRGLASALERVAAPASLSLDLAADPWAARVEALELERMLTNLVLNARDATLPGGHVSIVSRRLSLQHPMATPYFGVAAGEYVSLCIRDDGPGIPPSVREHLFEPFFTTKGEAGNGLGLASTFGLARRHGGLVRVESVEGEGATFEILLPRAT